MFHLSGLDNRSPIQYRYLPLFHSVHFLVSAINLFFLLAHESTDYYCRQLPGNLVLRRFGVCNFIAFIVVAWGAIELGMGFVSTWGYLTLCRILLGALEVKIALIPVIQPVSFHQVRFFPCHDFRHIDVVCVSNSD
jgi:hypothetical protein